MIEENRPELKIQPTDIPEDVQEKLEQFEGLTIEGLRGHARLEDESYEDYRLRREVEAQFKKYYIQGVAIKKADGPNRAVKKQMWKIFQREQRWKLFKAQKEARVPKMCPVCKKKFPKCDLQEHLRTYHRRRIQKDGSERTS